jgi:DNA-binding CsgD family transcriptional regulator
MDLAALIQDYHAEFDRLGIDPAGTDPGAVARHIPALQQLANIGNVGITVFDMLRREHVFCSINFQDLFGYDLERIATEGNAYFDSRVHPYDHLQLLRTGVENMRTYNKLPKAERGEYKVVNEYRIRNRDEQYVRILEQHQALECDVHGNIWLSLSVMDISPTQDLNLGLRSCFINYKTGKVLRVDASPAGPNADLPPSLSPREREILGLIGDGLLSKEISDRLSISIHTVNTHRQRILEKLNADNSMEAVNFARGLGLLHG